MTCVDQMIPTFDGSRPSARSAASTSARCLAIAGIGLRAPKMWSTKRAAVRVPRGEPPAWISTGVICGDGGTLSGPFTLKKRPTWLIARTLSDAEMC